MAVSANLDKILDKAYESSSPAELLNAPVAALAGVSDSDAELLQKAFNIKTIGDLAGNKYFKAAGAIAAIAAVSA
ncbi:hypothetical protein [Actinoplanes sp. NPDC049599]|uniref:hypothetical protein n=1 Tax=Actinoplanes sp. NPDC049599 TaxID=3363903 RepID=UPI0037A70910